MVSIKYYQNNYSILKYFGFQTFQRGLISVEAHMPIKFI